uniref:Ribbon-helix-helix protein, CopG family n=1 Tax=Ignisphaera aggregans TaxID=334771 RepID=A0A7J2U5L1_9CREN
MVEAKTFSWRNLENTPHLCEGGVLASIVFCCDPRKVRCPLIQKALNELGLTLDQYLSVVEKLGVPLQTFDGTCYSNLAFCPSLTHVSRDRDEFLYNKMWTVEMYLKYKFRILKTLLNNDVEMIAFAFSKRLLGRYIAVLLDVDTSEMYRAMLVGDIGRGAFRIERIEKISVETVPSDNGVIVSAMVPPSIAKRLKEIEKDRSLNKSEIIRRALQLFLHILSW